MRKMRLGSRSRRLKHPAQDETIPLVKLEMQRSQNDNTDIRRVEAFKGIHERDIGGRSNS